MIVCVCRNLCHRRIKAAIHAGANSPAHVMAHHGKRFQCGSCVATIDGMVRSHHQHADDREAPSAPNPADASLVIAAE